MTEVRQFVDKHHACNEGAKWALQYETMAEVYDNCQRGDWLLWVLGRAKKINKRQSVRIAIFCAERVLSIFEESHPDDDRPRKAIDAAKAYLLYPCQRTKAAADAAADAAAAAYAYAADAVADAVATAAAAYAAVATADTAAADADADADADAAADAAAAAYAAAAAADADAADDAAAAAYAAADAAAADAAADADAAYAAVADAAAAAYADAAYAYADAERKIQVDKVHKIISNPWKTQEHQ